MEYEKENGVRRIYCGYSDTEVADLYTNVTCPHCGNEQQELNKSDCGQTYKIICENDKCDTQYEMHFDAD